jgi:hypothetical protein
VDANIRIYAYHPDAPLYQAAADELPPVAQSSNPKSAEDAFRVIRELLPQPRVAIVRPEAGVLNCWRDWLSSIVPAGRF